MEMKIIKKVEFGIWSSLCGTNKEGAKIHSRKGGAK
jgi:hypothetical protein